MKNQDSENLKKQKELSSLKKTLLWSIFLSLPIALGSMLGFSWLKDTWLALFLATPVQFWIGSRFYISALRSLKNRSTNMDTLIALGTSVAYFYSLFVLIFKNVLIKEGLPTHTYLDTSSMIITFILLGNYLETKAKLTTSQAIRKLLALAPRKATVLREHKWVDVPVDDIILGDSILVKPGDTVPVDGIITQGESFLDESMVTGESMPIKKSVGDTVIGGTTNQKSSFQMKATKVGSQTLLAKIIELVKHAQASKAPIARMVDKVSAYFIPSVIVLSFLTFILWLVAGPEPRYLYAMINMVAVLIIACPCALGLATPISIMVGIGRGAQEGILIKDAQTLEIAGKISVIVLDKTGTLTEGKPAVTQVAFTENLNTYAAKLNWHTKTTEEMKQYIAQLIASLEEQSRHPIAKAALQYFGKDKQLFNVDSFESIEGFGIKGKIANNNVLIGNRRLLERESIFICADLDKLAQQWSTEARTVSYVAINGYNLTIFSVTDPIRPTAAPIITQLKKMGITPIMLTGDNQKTAQSVAQKLDIPTYFANVLPQEKQEYVQQLKKEYQVVAMVGDGVNDAPALAEANVGIAMGEGTDVAIETASVTLLKSDITLIPKVIALSRATIRNIYQNLAWAFGYNILLIPVAMGILYPFFGIMINPMFAGAAMAFSSLSVVLNALRLKRIKL